MTTTPIHDGDSGLLGLPQTPLAREVVELVTRTETPSIANHSIRTYLYARPVAAHRGLVAERDYDPELLFFACVLHDIGLTEDANKAQRFEVDGADFAAEFLARRGVGAAQVDTVWQAIALNTSLGIAERRGAVCALTLAGVSVDFGVDAAFIPDATAAAIQSAYPRISIGRATRRRHRRPVSGKSRKGPAVLDAGAAPDGTHRPAPSHHRRAVGPRRQMG